MKVNIRILWTLAILIGSLGVPHANAQSGSFRQVRVGLTTPGLTFYVDNTPYDRTQIFRWQVGDIHTIRVPKTPVPSPSASQNAPLGSAIGTRISYIGQYAITTDANQPLPIGAFQDLTRQEDPDYIYRIQMWSFLSTIDFTTSLQYQLRFSTPAVGCAPTAGTEQLAGACGDVPGYTTLRCSDGNSFVATTGDFWCPAGQTELTATPTVGYAFKDWNSNPGLPNSSTVGISGSLRFTLNSPFHIQVNFGPGKFYRINTDPPGLEVIIDRNFVKTGTLLLDNQNVCSRYTTGSIGSGNPVNVGQGGEAPAADFCTVWLVGSTRLMSATEVQQDKFGKLYVFDSWSFGGGQNSLFSVSGANLSTNVLTARFLPAANITFLTQPQTSLPLLINNRTWPTYNFKFGVNKDVSVVAPLESVDANGRRWRFKGWSNGAPASHTMRITQEMVDKGLYLTAFYEPLNKLSIETNPPGLPVTVDGQICGTPCAVERLAGESVSIVPAPSVTQAGVLRLEFTGWNDGAPAERLVGFQPELRRLVANYKQMYRLSATSNPPEGATFSFSPPSTDSFYDLDTRVTVTARAANGFRFRRWSGDTAGLFNSAVVTMGGPRGVVADLERIPFLDPAGIKNSAGTGPQDAGDIGKVAPGSLVTIYGVNLTPKEETGPRSPQVQTLAEVAVRAGERLLPLSYASGSQINAQLPFDMPLGPNKITVIRTGQPDVSADFEVVRNAPGLFSIAGTESEGVPPFALAFRANGSTITEDAPPAANEVISLMGTGLGGFRVNLPAGFAIPAGNELPLVDPVEVLVGDQTVTPLRVIATPGFVGMTSIQIRLGAQFPPGQTSTIRVRVNGKDSNTVRLLVR